MNFRKLKDVKTILKKFVESKTKREAQVRALLDNISEAEKYVGRKEQIIEIILKAQTNNELMKLYRDGNVVKSIYQKV